MEGLINLTKMEDLINLTKIDEENIRVAIAIEYLNTLITKWRTLSISQLFVRLKAAFQRRTDRITLKKKANI